VPGNISALWHKVLVRDVLDGTKNTRAKRLEGCGAIEPLETKNETGESDDISNEDAAFEGGVPTEH
jgi:hypothetical protein